VDLVLLWQYGDVGINLFTEGINVLSVDYFMERGNTDRPDSSCAGDAEDMDSLLQNKVKSSSDHNDGKTG